MLSPHVQVLALGFGEMVPCLLFGRSVEYRHNLLNCGRGCRGQYGRPKKERERGAIGKVQRSEKICVKLEGSDVVFPYPPLYSINTELG